MDADAFAKARKLPPPEPGVSFNAPTEVALAYITLHKLQVMMLRDSRELVVRRTSDSLVEFAKSLSEGADDGQGL